MGVEYGPEGPALWIQSNGTRKKVRLHTVEETYPFEKSSRSVKVKLDDSGKYAESILVLLAN